MNWEHEKHRLTDTTARSEALATPNQEKMNNTTIDIKFSSSGLCLGPQNRAGTSSHLSAVLIARIVVNALTCPLIAVLNILVIVAVRTKPQLRTKSNIALACLATTDLVVGLVLQPLQIARDISLLRGHIMFCTMIDLSKTVTLSFLLASFHHLVLMSAERYVAIKHPFVYETQVTEVRIVMGSAVAWAAAIILSSGKLLTTAIVLTSETLLIILPIYLNVSVYKEVRRNNKQIAHNQVSLEAKEKLLKNKKGFYTTVILLLVILLCYIPTRICVVILISLKERIAPSIRATAIYLLTLLPILNSLFNPLIYATRIRYFRVAFIQLLLRKPTAQAEELERKIFGVSCNVHPTTEKNQTLNNNHEPTRQA